MRSRYLSTRSYLLNPLRRLRSVRRRRSVRTRRRSLTRRAAPRRRTYKRRSYRSRGASQNYLNGPTVYPSSDHSGVPTVVPPAPDYAPVVESMLEDAAAGESSTRVP